MIRGCHARAILLPVGRKSFARFLASRRRPVRSSRRQLFFISKLSTYARKQKAQRWLQVDGEMQVAKSRHSKVFSVRSGIEMSMMRRQIEISIVSSSRTHKEIPAVRGRDFDCSQTT